jgi:cell division protein FtsL
MLYGLQHFSAIESGYKVESEKQSLELLREENRQLRLNEAQLTDPSRIDRLAREQGLAEPQPGQIIQPSEATGSSAPALAMVTPPNSAASF